MTTAGRSWILLIALALVVPAGCANKDVKDSAKNEDFPQVAQNLQELSSACNAYRAQRGSWPARLSDLESFMSAAPESARRVLTDGSIVFVENVKSPDHHVIVAYEKAAPTNGGWVLWSSGMVQKLTKDVFPKAKLAS
jgi:hypothetical protein